MKKILFATTALVATAGMAAAEISFGGYGRFGLRYAEQPSSSTSNLKETFLETRFRVNIDISAESDAGVRFSARVRMQADDDGDNGRGNAAGLNAARFSAEAGGLRIDVGNAAGAIDNLPNYYGYEPGLSNFVGQYSGVDYGFTGYASSSSAQPQTLYARYAFDAFAVAASYTTSTVDGASTVLSEDQWDIHFAYSGDSFTAAVGYGEGDNASGQSESLLVGTLNFAFGPADFVIFLADDDVAATGSDGLAYGFSGSVEVGSATDITFSYGDGEGDNDVQQYGVGFIHDLGGGVTLRGGIGQSDNGSEDQLLADLGVRFNF